MSLVATKHDFEEGGLYTRYRRYPFFAVRAESIIEVFDPSDVLVAGCGWGFLVDELRQRGVDAVGIDISAYALRKARELGFDFVQRGRMQSYYGGYELVVTEDLLPCANDDGEATRFIDQARSVGERVLHIITAKYENDSYDERLLGKSEMEWKALCRPDYLMFRAGVIT